MLIKSITSYFFLLFASAGMAVDTDYYFGPSLRTEDDKTCHSFLYEIYCNIKCGKKSGLCIRDQCYCVVHADAMANESPQLIHYVESDGSMKEIVLNSDYMQSSERERESRNPMHPSRADNDIEYSLLDALYPTKRHHIAHFCPNLDKARECIRTCMKTGKPAFCGKDHVCYCGHKYTASDKTSVANVDGTYLQFRDLYEKYFGPQQ